MIYNYLKIAIRYMLKNKQYFIINVIGLATGIAAFLMIMLWVYDEITYDTNHLNSANIYRLANHADVPGRSTDIATASGPMGPAVLEQFPEVINSVRISRTDDKTLISYGEKRFYETGVYYADDTIFDIFTFPLILGNPHSALSEPNSVVISKKISEKYFANDNPIGKTLITGYYEAELKVTGVLQDIPENSHLKFDFLIPLNSQMGKDRFNHNWWVNFSFYTYLLLDNNTSPTLLEAKFPKFVHSNMKRALDKAGLWITPFLQPLNDIHLHSSLEYELGPNGKASYVYIFSIIAVLVVLIACANYVNMSTAQSSKRGTEAGIRKIIGADKNQLIKQFMSESFIVTFLSFVLGLVIVELALPVFHDITGKNINFNVWENTTFFGALFGFMLLIGLLAGTYPSIFYSSTKALSILKGSNLTVGTNSSKLLRKSLILFQFAISIVLMVGSIIIFNQVRFMKSNDPGFTKEQIVIVPIHFNKLKYKHEYISNELHANTNILSVTTTSSVPGEFINKNLYAPDEKRDQSVLLSMVHTDENYINTFGLTITEGRNFNKQFPSDYTNAAILNETAVRNIGWDNPIDKTIKWYATGSVLRVIGVVKDYHFSSLQNKIDPMIMQVRQDRYNYFAIRIKPGDINGTLHFIEETFSEFDPYYPYEYFFLDKTFDNLYKADERFEMIFSLFTFFAILISCIGLLSLTSFLTADRTKEIGIRKVLGASIGEIVTELTKEFLSLILLANVIAWPIAWYLMDRWLQSYAYRIEIGIWHFLFPGSIALLVAFITISYKAIRAATANPVEALKYE